MLEIEELILKETPFFINKRYYSRRMGGTRL